MEFIHRVRQYFSYFHEFVCVCTPNSSIYFTHMETSLFLAKACTKTGPSVYNGHVQGPVTLRPDAERVAVQLF